MRPTLLFATSLSISSRLSPRPRFLSSLGAKMHRNSENGTIILTPEDASKHSATVILCHGLGDTAEGWLDPAQYLSKQLPHVKFVLPTAPTQPVTLNMGFAMPSWYDIVGLDSRSNEICNGLDESMDTIISLVENEVHPKKNDAIESRKSINYDRIVLAGFSQGGALALYTGMTQTRKNQSTGLGLAGILIMSGYLPRSKQFTIAQGSESTPILHCHGKEDSVVPVEAASMSQGHVSELMEKMGVREELYEVKFYPGLDHSVSMKELNDVVAYLERVIPRENAQVTGDPTTMNVRELKQAIKQAGLEKQARGMMEKSELVNLLRRHLNGI
ncbi:hypothetical protein ACHAXS_008331 [Conticribra weissflogii]